MISTAHNYAALQRRLDRVYSRVQQSIRGFCGYASDDVASRLLQRFAELGVFEYTRVAAETYRNTGSPPGDDETMNCGPLVIEGSRKIRITPAKFATLSIEFIAHWAYAFLTIVLSLRPLSVQRKISLLYGVGLQDMLAEGGDGRFLHFCRNGQLQPLVEADYLAIQAVHTIHSTDPTHVRYGRMPLMQALRWSGLGVQAWLNALAGHFSSAFSFLWAVWREPSLILLGSDAAYHAAAKALSYGGGLGDVILTNTNYFSQPLWVWALPKRRHCCHMVWYSQNNYPISYRDELEAIPIPNLRYVKADIQWVWTDGFRQFLEKICPPCAYKIVSPIVWHLPIGLRSSIEYRVRRIALFDVTPISHSTELKLGLLRNFYNEEIISHFILDVINAVQTLVRENGMAIEVVLKHKREHADVHSAKYIRTICGLADSGVIRLVEPNSNLYDLIQQSDLVIATPYSSPVYIARDTGRDAVWYDPTMNLEWKLGNSEIDLIQGLDALTTRLRQTFAK